MYYNASVGNENIDSLIQEGRDDIMTHNYRLIFSYHSWSIRKLISHLEQLPAGLLEEPVKNVFPSLLHTLEHINTADQLWLSRIIASLFPQAENTFYIQKPTTDQLTQGVTLATIKERFEQIFTGYMQVFETIGEDAAPVITYRNLSDIPCEYTLPILIQHVVNHGTYHIGNISSNLRQLGEASTPIDFTLYAQGL